MSVVLYHDLLSKYSRYLAIGMDTKDDMSLAMLNERVGDVDKWIALDKMRIDDDVELSWRDFGVQFMGRLIIYSARGLIYTVEKCRNRSFSSM